MYDAEIMYQSQRVNYKDKATIRFIGNRSNNSRKCASALDFLPTLIHSLWLIIQIKSLDLNNSSLWLIVTRWLRSGKEKEKNINGVYIGPKFQ